MEQGKLYLLIKCCISVNREGIVFFTRKIKLTSLWASVGRWEVGRVRLILPTRTGRILDQVELLKPAFRSGQLLPVEQKKGCKHRTERQEKKILLHHVFDNKMDSLQ